MNIEVATAKLEAWVAQFRKHLELGRTVVLNHGRRYSKFKSKHKDAVRINGVHLECQYGSGWARFAYVTEIEGNAVVCLLCKVEVLA